MKKKIQKTNALILAALLMLSLCACGSDYPVIDRSLDVTEFLNACYEGSGYSLNLENTAVTVSAVADRMNINMEQSQNAVEEVRAAVRSATIVSDGLHGTWTANVDVSAVICDYFRDIEGLELESYMGSIPVRSSLSFHENGIYILAFDEKELPNVRQSVLDAGAKAVKDYLTDQSDGAAKLLVRSIDEDTVSNLISYVADIILDMLENGAAGNYNYRNGYITFEKQGACKYSLNGDLLTLSDGLGEGLVRVLTSGDYVFQRG